MVERTNTKDTTSRALKMKTKHNFIEWVKVTRIQTAMVTSLALWVGYITTSSFRLSSILSLTVIGLLMHIWGFTLNEVQDYEYDKMIDDLDGHPIAQGDISATKARWLGWGAGVSAILLSFLLSPNTIVPLVLLCSMIPGHLYNVRSKRDWWSNVYLSAWAGLVVLAGAMYGGSVTLYTGAAIVAISIQIFVQVVQGDLKDLEGPESKFVERMGVRLKDVSANVYKLKEGEFSHEKSGSSCTVVQYSRKFAVLIYSLKFTEAALLVLIAVTSVGSSSILSSGDISMTSTYYALLMVVVIAFIASTSMFLVYCFDRDKIKSKSSIHEMTSIILIGLCLAPLDLVGGLIIMFAPVVWYASVNSLLHSNALSPDV